MSEYDFNWILFISDWELMKVVRKLKFVDIQQAFAIVGYTVNI